MVSATTEASVSASISTQVLPLRQAAGLNAHPMILLIAPPGLAATLFGISG
jgi:hypothetical protein